MRLVFVNQVHPASGIVAGVRLWRFAEELAKQGHRILFLTEGLPEGAAADRGERLSQRLAGHDWRAPLVIECGVAALDDPRRGRRTGRSRVLGKARTAIAIAFRGGVFWRWRHEARRYTNEIATAFRPELVYATFGNLDALNVAQDLSRACGVPWAMDVKDVFPRFVPRIFWPLVKLRYADAAAVTYNSEFTRDANADVLARAGAVVYSGADEGAHRPDATVPDTTEGPTFALIGGIYSDAAAFQFLSAFKTYSDVRRNAGLTAPRLCYLGMNLQRVETILEALGSPACISARSQMPRLELLALCRTMTANCYIATPQGFHHKLFELLAAGRPVIAYPREHAESLNLAADAGGELRVCRTAEELSAAWDWAIGWRESARAAGAAQRLAWSRFAAELERVFIDALSAAPAGGGPREHGAH